MKKYLLPFLVSLLPVVVQAGPVGFTPGSALTLGEATVPQNIGTASLNPAAGKTLINEKASKRFSYLSSVGLSVEIGDVDNFQDTLDELIDDLDRSNITSGAEGAALEAKYNAVLAQMAIDGTLTVQSHVAIPVTPLLMHSKTFGAALAFDGYISGGAKVSFFDAPVSYNGGTDEIETASALYVRAMRMTRVGLGLSKELPNLVDTKDARLLAGAKLNYYNVELSRQIISLDETKDDVGGAISDGVKSGQTNSALGLDLGLLWQAENYQVGMRWENLNEPSFNYNTVDVVCSSQACTSAALFTTQGRLDLEEEYVMENQVSIEGSLYTKSRKALLTASYDTNAAMNAFGDDEQWLNAGVTYFPEARAIPSLRVGYSANQAGSELSSLNVGATLFKVVTLDVRYGLESTKVDGDATPRMAAVNLGVSSSF